MTSISRRVRMALAAAVLGSGLAAAAIAAIDGAGTGGGSHPIPPGATAILAEGAGPVPWCPSDSPC